VAEDKQGYDADLDYTAVDNLFWDGTDAAHPAFWRGQEAAIKGLIRGFLKDIEAQEVIGTVSDPEIQFLRELLVAITIDIRDGIIPV
jgi:hypothetical protein